MSLRCFSYAVYQFSAWVIRVKSCWVILQKTISRSQRPRSFWSATGIGAVGTSCMGTKQRLHRAWPSSIVTLRSNDADGNENVKRTIGLISKTKTSHVHHTFLYISFPFLHDYDVKMPNFAFYGGRKQATTKFYFSFWAWIWSLEIQLQEGSPTIDEVSG